ncbi:hypothetical protein [Catellatospora sp. NPDC049133]|uniref:hypothetical protein n=1 Tax=Catellatospora sp. NPDC049133 TaxID=3155499 RepID=UPI0033FB6FEF
MLSDHDELWRLLRSLDDPQGLEFPTGYDGRRERARFEQLAQRLDAAFGGACEVDRHVQVASLHGRIEVPAALTATGSRLVVSISNFGGMAVLAVDNPGVWTDEEAAELLHSDDGGRIGDALASLGYVLIPEEPLWQRYDGAWPRVQSWWDRFFDYL